LEPANGNKEPIEKGYRVEITAGVPVDIPD